jgi:hypothetical protein
MAVVVRIVVFWDSTSYSPLYGYRHFGETCCLYIQGRRQHAPPKCGYPPVRIHSVTTQKNTACTINIRGGLISLWLYKENKLRNWKKCYFIAVPLTCTIFRLEWQILWPPTILTFPAGTFCIYGRFMALHKEEVIIRQHGWKSELSTIYIRRLLHTQICTV